MAALPLEKTGKKYTYEDYLTWPDNEKWELIDGEPYDMSPTPLLKHQMIVGKFYYVLEDNLKSKSCTPLIAPTEVKFSEDDVAHPDILVVCDKSKLVRRGVRGVPDLIVEVVSPSGITRDKGTKKNLYERFGVKEYVIVDPIENYVERFNLGEDKKYNSGEIFETNETMKLLSLGGMEVSLSEVFVE